MPSRRLLLVTRSPFIAAIVLSLTATVAQAQLVPYDNFAGPKLDAEKWSGRQFVTREDGTGSLLEVQREITPLETLVLQARSVGGDASNSGLFTAENALLFRHSKRLTDIAFTAFVRSAQVAGCTGGADAAVSARGVFPLFDDGSGDVVAIVEVTRSSASPAAFDVVASLVHRGAEAETILGYAWLGSVDVNVKVKLRVKWDPANSVVRINKDGDIAAALGYANVIASEPRARKYLGAWTSVPDCLSGTAPTAAITALFNNVRVNP
jgi:hypothetical protein